MGSLSITEYQIKICIQTNGTLENTNLLFVRAVKMAYRVQIQAGGRLILPKPICNELGIKPGDDLILRLEEGYGRLLSLPQAVIFAQHTVRRYIEEGTSLVDEFIESRRDEAGKE